MTSPPEEDDLQFKLIAEKELLQDVVDAVGSLVREAKFHFLDGLIRIWVVDPANAAACYIDIDPEETEQIQHYSVQDGGLVQGLNLQKLDDLFGYADSGDLVKLEFGEAHNWMFNITMPGVDVNIAGIDPDSVRQEPDKPDVGWPAQFSLSGESLKDAVDLNDMFSDHTTIRAGDHQVEFIAEGDTDDGTYRLEEGEGELEFHQNGETQEVMQSLAYLEDMAKVLKKQDDVRMKVASDKPTMIQFDLGTFMLAPRIDSSS